MDSASHQDFAAHKHEYEPGCDPRHKKRSRTAVTGMEQNIRDAQFEHFADRPSLEVA